MIHNDLKTVPVLSYHKYKYVLTFLDDYTRHSWVTFLKDKASTYDGWLNFVAMIKNQHKKEVYTIICDMRNLNPQGLLSTGAEGFERPSGSYVSSKTLLCHNSEKQKLVLELITEEGGDRLVNFLLAAAKRTPPNRHKQSSKSELPDSMNICEWVYKDILHFPGKLKEEWRQACLNEIDALKQYNVFELIPLPKGRKAIGNR